MSKISAEDRHMLKPYTSVPKDGFVQSCQWPQTTKFCVFPKTEQIYYITENIHKKDFSIIPAQA